jgi:hypothetical protein
MATQDKPLIYIGYNRKDQKWLEYVQSYLDPAAQAAGAEVWIDTKVSAGDNLRSALEDRLQRCVAYVLLVSPNAMASQFIDSEIEVIRTRERDGENVRLFPILLTPTSDVALAKIGDKRWRPDRSLSTFQPAQRNQQMAAIAAEIIVIVTQRPAPTNTKTQSAPPPGTPAATSAPAAERRAPHVVISWIGTLDGRSEQEAYLNRKSLMFLSRASISVASGGQARDVVPGDIIVLPTLAARPIASALPFDTVQSIQSALRERGFGPEAIDGTWGPATAQALTKFQASSNLAADGMPGPQTLQALLGTYPSIVESRTLVAVIGSDVPIVLSARPDQPAVPAAILAEIPDIFPSGEDVIPLKEGSTCRSTRLRSRRSFRTKNARPMR